MADTAARLVDEVLPHLPVRQFVLSLLLASLPERQITLKDGL